MRWTKVCPLIGLALFACATAENETPLTPGLTTGDQSNGGSEDASGNGGGGSAAESGGRSAQAGASSGGTFSPNGGGSLGGASIGGTFGTTAGTAGVVAGASGGGGAPGGAAGSAGAGGKANGGAGGKANGGAGSGGTAGNAQCAGVTIPAKTTWKGSALESAADSLPAKAFDGDDTTRFATGDPQDGDEWLEIDFGAIVTLNEITMHTNNNDYFRHYQLRLSNKEHDLTTPVLDEADGKTGSLVVMLSEAHAGRYLNIKQTGVVTPTWWSLHEVTVACK